MKGTIVVCLKDVVELQGGPQAWAATLEDAGTPGKTFTAIEIVPDEDVLKLMASSAKVLGIPVQGAMDAFGEHWSLTYAPSIYKVYYDRFTNARDFLLNMDNVHVAITKNAGGTPPRFTFEDKGPKELVMNYSSPRHLSALMPSLIKGVGKYYKEYVGVRVTGNAMHITFR